MKPPSIDRIKLRCKALAWGFLFIAQLKVLGSLRIDPLVMSIGGQGCQHLVSELNSPVVPKLLMTLQMGMSIAVCCHPPDDLMGVVVLISPADD